MAHFEAAHQLMTIICHLNFIKYYVNWCVVSKNHRAHRLLQPFWTRISYLNIHNTSIVQTTTTSQTFCLSVFQSTVLLVLKFIVYHICKYLLRLIGAR